MLSSTIAVPRCSVIFDGANYRDFTQHMCVHIHGLCLWGILCHNVPCPSSLELLTKPVQSTFNKGDKAGIDIALATYEKVVSACQEALELYYDWLPDCAQWMDDDAHAASILITSVKHMFS